MRGQRTVFGGVGDQFVDGERKRLRCGRCELQLRPLKLDPSAGGIGRDFLLDQPPYLRALPVR